MNKTWFIVELKKIFETCLSSREADILKRRLDGETFNDIALNYGVTRERIRQIEARALTKLKLKVCLKEREEIVIRCFDCKEVINEELGNINLPTRVVNALKRDGFFINKSIRKARRSDLLKVKNIGVYYANLVCEYYGLI